MSWTEKVKTIIDWLRKTFSYEPIYTLAGEEIDTIGGETVVVASESSRNWAEKPKNNLNWEEKQ